MEGKYSRVVLNEDEFKFNFEDGSMQPISGKYSTVIRDRNDFSFNGGFYDSCKYHEIRLEIN